MSDSGYPARAFPEPPSAVRPNCPRAVGRSREPPLARKSRATVAFGNAETLANLETLLDSVRRSTVEQKALSAVLLAALNQSRDQKLANNMMLWKLARVAEHNQPGTAQEKQKPPVLRPADEESRPNETPHALRVELRGIVRAHRKPERSTAVGVDQSIRTSETIALARR